MAKWLAGATLAFLFHATLAIAEQEAATTEASLHRGPVTGLLRHGQRLLSCSNAGVLTTDLAGGDQRWLLQPPFRVLSIASTADDSPLVVVGGGMPAESGIIALLDVESGRLIAERIVADDLVYAVAVDPVSKTVAAACADGDVLSLPLDNLEQAALAKHQRHTATARDVSFSPDGSRLASCGHDGFILVSLVQNPDKSRPTMLAGHTAAVHCLAFSPEGNRIASGSRNGRVRVHQIEGPQLRSYSILDGEISVLVWDGSGLFAGTSEGSIYRLSPDDDSFGRLAADSAPTFALAMLSPTRLAIARFAVSFLDIDDTSKP